MAAAKGPCPCKGPSYCLSDVEGVFAYRDRPAVRYKDGQAEVVTAFLGRDKSVLISFNQGQFFYTDGAKQEASEVCPLDPLFWDHCWQPYDPSVQLEKLVQINYEGQGDISCRCNIPFQRLEELIGKWACRDRPLLQNLLVNDQYVFLESFEYFGPRRRVWISLEGNEFYGTDPDKFKAKIDKSFWDNSWKSIESAPPASLGAVRLEVVELPAGTLPRNKSRGDLSHAAPNDVVVEIAPENTESKGPAAVNVASNEDPPKKSRCASICSACCRFFKSLGIC